MFIADQMAITLIKNKVLMKQESYPSTHQSLKDK